MKKLILFLYSLVLFANIANAQQCFVAKEKDKIIQQIEDCDVR